MHNFQELLVWKEAMELALKSDSLSRALKKNEVYIKSVQKVLTGELEYAKFNKDSILYYKLTAPQSLYAYDLKKQKSSLVNE